jgi:hypothetical protein
MILNEEVLDNDPLPFYTNDPNVLDEMYRLAEAEFLDSQQESFQCPVCHTTNDYPGPCSRECSIAWNAAPDAEELFYDRNF